MYKVQFTAYGHPSVTAKHKRTIMLTKEDYLTPQGDCVIGIKAEKGLSDLGEDTRRAARSKESMITLSIQTGDITLNINGKGHPNLTYDHPTDIVARKSSYTCNRTLMIDANIAACDISKEIINLLQKNDQKITVTITISVTHNNKYSL
jgi:hypothetical protein